MQLMVEAETRWWGPARASVVRALWDSLPAHNYTEVETRMQLIHGDAIPALKPHAWTPSLELCLRIATATAPEKR